MTSLPSTQKAVALPAKRTPFVELDVPVYSPASGEVVIHVQWTASTPLDLHRADGGLLISEYPEQMGSGGAAGTVVAVGEGGDLKNLKIDDRVVTFAFHGGQEANHQEYITIPAYLASKIPDSLSFEAAVTVPVNLVTVFHTATADLDLELPWPIPEGWTPKHADELILVWGAASSVGIFALQVFKHWGYKNIIAIASGKHHAHLRGIGATETFDYRKEGVVDAILAHAPKIPYILDCVGSVDGTLKPLTKIAQAGSKVAIMLPVILKDATEDEEPEYEMDASKCLVGEWAEGVIVRGVRTHFYLSVSPRATSTTEVFQEVLLTPPRTNSSRISSNQRSSRPF
ncbi:chaperonin 10-like protein [Thelonectria olida]|uniref:Chaperonin 10-like protein n=1 Tax=Thelonectria olida TaxID=1576542 RepID=A0A9P9AYN3_9HYPO|nr:chaperonin 10-like protein [Thelonectria olida]